MGSITEVVQTVRDPKSSIRSMSHDNASKLEEQEKTNSDFVLPKSVEVESISSTNRQTASLDFQADKSKRKSGRISFIRYIFPLLY